MSFAAVRFWVSFAFAGALFGQAPAVTQVVDAASFGNTLAPGSLAIVFGTNLNAVTSCSVGGKASYIVSQSPTQMTIEISPSAPIGATTLTGIGSAFNLSRS